MARIEQIKPSNWIRIATDFKKYLMNKLFTLLFVVSAVISAAAQNSKSLTEAQQLFSFKKYEQALPLFLDALKSGSTGAEVQYQVGICYQKSQNISNQIKAIPYFEDALNEMKGIPVSV